MSDYTYTEPRNPRHKIFLYGFRNLLIAPFKLLFVIFAGVFAIGLFPALHRFGHEFFYQVILPILYSLQRAPRL